MLDDGNSKAPKFGLVTHTRLHENISCVNRTERQNHLASCANAANDAVMRNLHSGDSPTFEGQPGDQCVRENCEIRPVHMREDITSENRLTFSRTNSQI